MIKIIRHNAGICVASMVCVLLLLWTYGCESKVLSPVTGKSVTYAELALDISAESKRIEGELDLLNKQAELQFTELERKEEIKRKLYDFAAIAAQNNAFNPTGIITLVGSLLGIGAIVDNRIKDVVIKNRPLNNVVPKTT
jgi:hypothetical protein